MENVTPKIIKEITVNPDGQGFITAQGVVRLLKLGSQSITKNLMPLKLDITLTRQGIDPTQRPFSDEALFYITWYYAYISQKPSTTAQQLFGLFGVIGARTWLQKVKGWTPFYPANISVTGLNREPIYTVNEGLNTEREMG